MTDSKIVLFPTSAINNLVLNELVNYSVSKSMLEWCTQFIKVSPDAIQNIIDMLLDIVVDKKIEVVDIPNLVLLVVGVLQSECKIHNMTNSEYILSFTKILNHMIIDFELFEVSPTLQNNDIVNAMFNSCFELLQVKLYCDIIYLVKPEKTFLEWIFDIVCFWK